MLLANLYLGVVKFRYSRSRCPRLQSPARPDPDTPTQPIKDPENIGVSYPNCENADLHLALKENEDQDSKA